MHEAPVAAERRLRGRIAVNDADERLLGVFPRVCLRDVLRCLAWTKRRIARRDEAPVHRNEVRREREFQGLPEQRRGFLRDLGGVPVLRHAVWADALVDRAEEERVLDSMTRAAHAGL